MCAKPGVGRDGEGTSGSDRWMMGSELSPSASDVNRMRREWVWLVGD
ncbi:hypothetical protein [Pasteuria penetrans]|nr:hypothetical protein [Pasteuria penetrans]